MKNLIVLIVVCCAIFSGKSQAQIKPIIPNTYALIVGVSHYKNADFYPTLEFARRDGQAFYNYMRKSNFAQIPATNIDTLYDEEATSAAIFQRLASFKNKLKDGDLLYFYFTGHGDANEEGAYLLAHDAPNNSDKNNYTGSAGVIDIHAVKRLFDNITDKKVQLVFISDACRTNELAGGEEGQTEYGKAIEIDAGEIRFTSCKSNQFSYEGPQWGQGRSVFSYHLINGLIGLADSDEDENNYVDFDELQAYVKKKVMNETKTQPVQQVPQFFCSEKKISKCEVPLNYVNQKEKDQLIAILNNQMNSGDIAAVAKGVDVEDALAKFGKKGLYDEFMKRIKQGKLIGEESAQTCYNQLVEDASIPTEIKEEINSKYCIYLGNDVNDVINKYLDGSLRQAEYTKKYFVDAYDKLEVFKGLSNTYEFDKDKIDANSYFFKGHSYFLSTRISDLNTGIAYLDSALALNPRASYIYNGRAVLSYKFSHWNEMLKDLNSARKFAPGWGTPVNNSAYIFYDMGRVDSAFYYNSLSIEMNPEYIPAYTLRARMHYAQGDKDSAWFYVNKALSLDSLDYNAFYWKAYLTKEEGKNEEAKTMFRKLHTIDPKRYDANAAILEINMVMYPENVDSLQVYMQGIVDSDTTNSDTYNYLAGILYNYELWDLANTYYNAAYALDELNISTLIGLGQVYEKLYDTKGDENGNKQMAYLDTSILFYGYSIILDTLQEFGYNRLGNKFYYLSNYDNDGVGEYTTQLLPIVAQKLGVEDITLRNVGIAGLKKAYELNKYNPMNSSNLGFVLMDEKMYEDAIPYFEAHFQQYAPFDENYLFAVRCYAQLGDVDKVCYYLQVALDSYNSYFVYKSLKKDPLLKPVMKDKKVKKLIKQFKGFK
ncbi:MAG: caspase family protein [Bacteroidota bacterium]